MPERTPSEAPFYIDQIECVACGACQAVAPDLIEVVAGPHGTYRFKRQPETPGEIDRAIAAINGCCVACIYYSGGNPAIVSRISDFSVNTCHAGTGTVSHPGSQLNFHQPLRYLPRTAPRVMMVAGTLLFAFADLGAIFDPHPAARSLSALFATGLLGLALFFYAKTRT